MDEKPHSLRAPVLTRLGASLIGVISITSSIFALALFNHYNHVHGDTTAGQSIVFASFAINSIVYIFAYRSMRLPLYRMNRLSENKPLIWAAIAGFVTLAIAFLVPGLRTLMGIVPLSLAEWGMVIGIGLVLLVLVEIGKAISSRIHVND